VLRSGRGGAGQRSRERCEEGDDPDLWGHRVSESRERARRCWLGPGQADGPGGRGRREKKAGAGGLWARKKEGGPSMGKGKERREGGLQVGLLGRLGLVSYFLSLFSFRTQTQTYRIQINLNPTLTTQSNKTYAPA
jgi:hypothetical protein